MKNKAPLALMEQLVMLLVFALAAGLCLQVFVLSDGMSRRFEARDHAVLAVQNAAETVKLSAGDLDECEKLLGGAASDTRWTVYYDGQWNAADEQQAEYCVTTDVTHQSLLGTAKVAAADSNGEILFEVTVSWQEAAYE